MLPCFTLLRGVSNAVVTQHGVVVRPYAHMSNCLSLKVLTVGRAELNGFARSSSRWRLHLKT
jgi:hypothetical protein